MNSKPYQISEMELFTTEVNGIQPLAMFPKSSILDIWQASDMLCNICNVGFEPLFVRSLLQHFAIRYFFIFQKWLIYLPSPDEKSSAITAVHAVNSHTA